MRHRLLGILLLVAGGLMIYTVATADVSCRNCADDSGGLGADCCSADCSTTVSCDSCCNKQYKRTLKIKAQSGSGIAGKLSTLQAKDMCKTDCGMYLN